MQVSKKFYSISFNSHFCNYKLKAYLNKSCQLNCIHLIYNKYHSSLNVIRGYFFKHRFTEKRGDLIFGSLRINMYFYHLLFTALRTKWHIWFALSCSQSYWFSDWKRKRLPCIWAYMVVNSSVIVVYFEQLSVFRVI
jgi:hypothetical protein